MTLSEDEKLAVEDELRRMIAGYRAKPTQEKEDGMGVEIAAMPAERRDYVPTALLRILAEERSAGT
jgi:hypothetical protein